MGLATEIRTGFGWGNLKERDYLEYLGIDRRKILKWILKKWAESV
jgi:hypothetical protein